MASSQLKWFDSSQPQTLQAAVMLCYINAFFGVLALFAGSGLAALLLLAEGAAGVAVANEKKIGYWVAVVIAGLFVVLEVLGLVVSMMDFSFSIWVLLNLAFAVVLMALLLHRQSREYKRIWFH